MSNLPTTKAVDLTLNDEWLTILFNQPEKRNALTEELTSDIKNVLGSIKEDMSIRGVSMRGEGGVFCAGGDLKSFKSGFQGGEQALEDVYNASAMTGDFFDMIKDSPNLKSKNLEDDEKTKLMCLSGVKQYPMRVKCATLSWHTLVSAMENDGKEISTEE